MKNKINTALNITSLALGVTILLLIASYTLNELRVDTFHSKEERIYKISYGNSSLTPGPLNSFLKDKFPEIEKTTHIETHQLNMFSPVIQFDSNAFEIERYYSADKGFFEIFDFEVVHGNIQTAFDAPFSLILTESESVRIFKDINPIGETLIWKGIQDYNFTVRAIVKDLPSNSSIQFNGLVSDASLSGMRRGNYSEDWGYTVFESYVLLKPNVDSEILTEKLRDNLKEHYANNLSSRASANDAELNPLSLHPLKKVYFDKSLTNDTTNRGNVMLVNILIIIGGIIMLLSLINYVNLTTANTASRTKQIGVQKLFGSSRGKLIFQYICETTFISLFAVAIGSFISLVFMEEYGNFMHVTNALKFQPSLFKLLIPFTLFLGLVAGIYPALLISSKKAIEIIKLKADINKGSVRLRQLLIIFQFTVTIVLIASTFLIVKQVNYVKNKDIGIPSEQVVYAKLPFPILAGNKEVLRERLQTIPEIEEIAFSSNMFGGIEGMNSQEIDGRTLNFATTWVDAEFIELYNLQLVDGRFFSKDLITDVNTTVLLNEAAVRKFNVENPFELSIRVPGGNAKVVGVVKDFNYKSLHNKIEPLAIVYLPRQGQYVNLKISENKLSETIKEIGAVWEELAPGFPFSYHFLDQSFEKLYQKDEQMAEAVSLFSIIALVIAILGIIGLSMFLAENRTKEIGIRRVNGAKISELLIMLNKDFIKWVVIAFVIALPIAYYSMHSWLQNFAYRTNLSWWIFVLAGLLAMVVALIAVSLQSWSVARRNPVEALRYE